MAYALRPQTSDLRPQTPDPNSELDTTRQDQTEGVTEKEGLEG
jgi:hypothetical protein